MVRGHKNHGDDFLPPQPSSVSRIVKVVLANLALMEYLRAPGSPSRRGSPTYHPASAILGRRLSCFSAISIMRYSAAAGPPLTLQLSS